MFPIETVAGGAEMVLLSPDVVLGNSGTVLQQSRNGVCLVQNGL